MKPGNILLDTSGSPRLTGFDLVSVADSVQRTKTGAMVGSYLYMAPEQMQDAKEADARADVYGLAMTAIFCLHGKELPAIMHRQPEKVIAGLSCSEEMKVVLAKAIEVEPEGRYADARAFCEALRGTTTTTTARRAEPILYDEDEPVPAPPLRS